MLEIIGGLMKGSERSDLVVAGEPPIHEFVSEFDALLMPTGVTQSRSTQRTSVLIRASNDIEAVQRFLKEYRESPETFRAYEKERFGCCYGVLTSLAKA